MFGDKAPFASLSVIFCGKLYQLPPVNDSPFYSFCIQSDMKSFLSFDFWRLFEMAQPTELARQKGD